VPSARANTRSFSAAAAALDLALADPEKAAGLAERAIAAGAAARDQAEVAIGQQAYGLALRYLDRPRESLTALRKAVRTAQRAGLGAVTGRARRSLAVALSDAGRQRDALAALDQAGAELCGVELSELAVQRAVVLNRLGRSDAVLAAVPAVLPELRAAGALAWAARGHNALGLAAVDVGSFTAADAHFAEASALFDRIDQHADAAGNLHNRGWVASLLGDIPTALAFYESAEHRFAALRLPLAGLQPDRVRLQLAAGLSSDALGLARQVAADLAERHADALHADALLLVGEAALADAIAHGPGGGPGPAAGGAERAAEAVAAIEQARQLLRRQGREGAEVLARALAVRARYVAGERGPRLGRDAVAVAEVLAGQQRQVPAREALLIAGRLALERGDVAAAEAPLREAAAGRRGGTAPARARGWYAEALLRRASGNRRGAAAALLAGLRVLEAHRAGLGAIELRANLAGQAADLVRLGRELSVESGRPAQVLRWFEYGRAAALRLPPVKPPPDPKLAGALAELRLVAGQPDSPARRRRQADLLDRLRRRTHRLVGPADPVTRLTPPAADVIATLGDRALVSMCPVRGVLHAVVVAGGTVRLVELAPEDQVETEARFLLMRLRRALLPAQVSGAGAGPALGGEQAAPATALAGSGAVPTVGSGPDVAAGALTAAAVQAEAAQLAASAGLHAAGRLVDDLLLAPLAPLIEQRELVLVPPPGLAGLPWSVLPTAAGRPITLAPSVAAWHAATLRPARPGPALLVAGPGLSCAEPEIRALAPHYPHATVLCGQSADATRTLAGLRGASVAHLAAHGTVHPDNPLFSSLRLADGPLLAYDLERLDPPPDAVVLSACDSAATGARGEELLGLALVLLHVGARTVVGTLAPVPDTAALAVTARLHQHIRAGLPVPSALAAAAADAVGSGDPLAAAVAHAFVAIGGTPPDAPAVRTA
jgi:tetratricopeptide (TPR) repeat protein